jgi:uncharacterized protein YyaL (SSP411 family)
MNRLAAEKAHLLQHGNPVGWFPWGRRLAEARRA